VSSEVPKYTTVLHEARLSLGLTLSEYCIADTIYKLSTNPKSRLPGWCYASKETLGDTIGISRQSIHKILTKLEKNEIIEKDTKSNNIKTTQKWYENCVLQDQKSVKKIDTNECKQSLQGVNKVDKNSKQSLHADSKQSLHNIYDDNDNIDNNKDNSPAGGPTEVGELAENAEIKKSKNIGTLIGIFEKVNPTPSAHAKNPYNVKANRDAAVYVIEKVGMEEAVRLCKLMIEQAGVPYAPLVPNIYTMMLKLFDVIAWDKRLQNPEKKTGFIVRGTDFSNANDFDWEENKKAKMKELEEHNEKIRQQKEKNKGE
jgi:hypothetical protein